MLSNLSDCGFGESPEYALAVYKALDRNSFQASRVDFSTSSLLMENGRFGMFDAVGRKDDGNEKSKGREGILRESVPQERAYTSKQ